MKTKAETLADIEKVIIACKKCRLCEKATNAVPGEGNIDAEIAFVGEAPGEKEDLSGHPFVGRAGKLLEAILEKLGYKRTDVWIGNIIKHRPPENRDPLPDEIKACEGYLTAQLEAIKPLVVVTLGRFSMNYFYPEGKISQVRGNLIRVGNFNVYPIYHPAAALRNPTMMEGFKHDFAKLPRVLKEVREGKIPEAVSPTILNKRPEEIIKTQTSEKKIYGQIGLF